MYLFSTLYQQHVNFMYFLQFTSQLGHGQGFLLLGDPAGPCHSWHCSTLHHHSWGAGASVIPPVRQDRHAHPEWDGLQEAAPRHCFLRHRDLWWGEFIMVHSSECKLVHYLMSCLENLWTQLGLIPDLSRVHYFPTPTHLVLFRLHCIYVRRTPNNNSTSSRSMVWTLQPGCLLQVSLQLRCVARRWQESWRQSSRWLCAIMSRPLTRGVTEQEVAVTIQRQTSTLTSRSSTRLRAQMRWVNCVCSITIFLFLFLIITVVFTLRFFF